MIDRQAIFSPGCRIAGAGTASKFVALLQWSSSKNAQYVKNILNSHVGGSLYEDNSTYNQNVKLLNLRRHSNSCFMKKCSK